MDLGEGLEVKQTRLVNGLHVREKEERMTGGRYDRVDVDLKAIRSSAVCSSFTEQPQVILYRDSWCTCSGDPKSKVTQPCVLWCMWERKSSKDTLQVHLAGGWGEGQGRHH